LIEALRLLEDDSLGGGGSRGNGRVRFSGLRLTWRNRDFYAAGAGDAELVADADLSALQGLAAGELAERLA
jgi:CRISPR-associated protein Csm3